MSTSNIEEYRIAVDLFTEAEQKLKEATDKHNKACRCEVEGMETMASTLRLADRCKAQVEEARELIRETISAVWNLLPILPKTIEEAPDNYWRGTLLKRVVIDPNTINDNQNTGIKLLDMDAFGPDRNKGAVDFASTLEVAKNFATIGDPLDSANRQYPIIIKKVVKKEDWPPGYYEKPNKLTFEVEDLFNQRMQIFRVLST